MAHLEREVNPALLHFDDDDFVTDFDESMLTQQTSPQHQSMSDDLHEYSVSSHLHYD